MQTERFNDRGFLSDAVARGPLIWIAGTVSNPQLAGIEAQTRDVLAEIDRRLAHFGASRAELLNVNIWLADIEDWAAMNTVWSEWIGGIPSPARAVVGAQLMRPFLVEIAGVAYRAEPG